MMQLRRVTFVCFVVITLWGCRSTSQSESGVRGVAFQPEAKNVALIMGAPQNLPKVPEDLEKISQLFSTHLPDQKFDVIVKNKVTKQIMLESLESAAVEVGDLGTLFVFINGHGSRYGSISAEDFKDVSYVEMGRALNKRRERPIRRVVFVVHTCYAGTATKLATTATAQKMSQDLLNGVRWFNEHLDKSPNLLRLKVDLKRLENSGLASTNDADYFGQIAIFMSSSSIEVSVGSYDKGAHYVESLVKAFDLLSTEYRDNATFQLFHDTTSTLMKQNFPAFKQQPVFMSMPKSLANENIFASEARVTEAVEQRTPAAKISRAKLAREWLEEVVAGVNGRIKNCVIKIQQSDVEPNGFLFAPEFSGMNEAGEEIKDIYLGTLSWMSDPAVSIGLLVNTFVEGSHRTGLEGCIKK